MDPAAPARRSRRKQARPGEITRAALACFARSGFAATRLEDVAAAAGISKGTIYLYFATKEELFQAVVREAVLPNLEAAEAELAQYQGPTSDVLRLLAERFLRVLETDVTAVPKLVLAESGNFPGIAQFYADTVLRRAAGLVQRILARGVERGEFRRIDPHTVLPLFGAPFVLLLLWKHSLARHTDLQLDARAVMATHLDLLLRGLAA